MTSYSYTRQNNNNINNSLYLKSHNLYSCNKSAFCYIKRHIYTRPIFGNIIFSLRGKIRGKKDKRGIWRMALVSYLMVKVKVSRKSEDLLFTFVFFVFFLCERCCPSQSSCPPSPPLPCKAQQLPCSVFFFLGDLSFFLCSLSELVTLFFLA